MHFSKTYAEAAKDLPPEWLPYLISYKALKKCISQIVKELEGRGLPVDLLKELSQKQEDIRKAEGTSHSELTTSSIELPPTLDTGQTALQLGHTSMFQQVIHSGSQHKVLYTFADSSHPCLLLIVNEGAEKELFSTENSPGSTAPSSPVLIPDAPHVATGHLATDSSDDESTTGTDNRLMQRLSELTLDDISTVDARRVNESTGISPMLEEYQLLRPEEEEEEDPEEDLRHEQREQEEMDRHFSSRDHPSNPRLNSYTATTSRPPSATPSTLSIPHPVCTLLEPMTPTSLINGDASCRDSLMETQTADERDARTFQELAASAASAESARRKQRRRPRRSFATVYADDGQAVRIARSEDQHCEKGLKSPDSRHPIIELESKTSQNPGNMESCPCALAEQGQIDEHGNRIRTVKVTLSTDVNFFNTILSAITKLADFQNTIKTVYYQKIRRVGDLVSSAATPHSTTFGFHRSSDLYAWREIMATFAEEEIWFDESRTEMRGDSANLEKCRARLDHWEAKAIRQCYPKLRMEKSKIAFADFLKLNRDLLAMKQFRELNKMAIGKILKKHDKRTMLISRSGFETLIATNTFISESLIHALSFSIANQLMTIIPQPQDYSCPVCLSISWKPIRLNCGHIFCVRCLIKAQTRKMTNCPLCRRSGSVEQANAGNLDVPLMNLMQLYFPKEIKEKRRDNAREVLEYEGY